MLPYIHRLNSKHLKSIYNDGKKYRGEFGMLVVKEFDTGPCQFAFVVSKKIGNAVQRHAMTRLLRQITIETVKEYGLEDKPYKCQYIAFKYCNTYEKLKEEYSKQIRMAFTNS